MATLTPTEVVKISEIVEITPEYVNFQITRLGVILTPEKEAAIREAIAEWDAGVKSKFVHFKSTESNEGFSLSSEAPKNAIRRKIALMFERPDWAGSSDQFCIVRG